MRIKNYDEAHKLFLEVLRDEKIEALHAEIISDNFDEHYAIGMEREAARASFKEGIKHTIKELREEGRFDSIEAA